MKKIRLAALVALAPLTFLCACGGLTPLSMDANWYKDTSSTVIDSNTNETLTYKVTFEEPTSPLNFGVKYDEGSYVTTLTASQLSALPDVGKIEGFADGYEELVYVYKTTLSIGGKYFFENTQGEQFNDTVTTTTVFRSVNKKLAPLYSMSEMQATVLKSAEPTSLEGVSQKTHTSRKIVYSADTKKATVTLTDLSKAEPTVLKTKTMELNFSGSFFENDQILFAMRSLNLSSAITFQSLDPQTNNLVEVHTQSIAAEEFDTTGIIIDGQAAPAKMDSYTMTISYNQTMSGAGRTVWYAAKESGSTQNTYRNVLLRFDTPLMYGLGTLRYSLVNADFSD